MSASSATRLVVVDDEPVILDLLAAVLEDGPWELIRCGCGREAVRAFEGGVDLLLTDKNLPDIGGLELVRQARAITPDVEALIITGYASLDTALEAMKLEVFDYIVKPPKDIFEVKRKVGLAHERQRMARENRRLLTELRERNEQMEANLRALHELQAELVQAEKLAGIGTLAAGVAHEISSPLFGVMGLAEAILDEDDPKLVKEYAAEIVEHSGTIKEIISELTGYARTASTESAGAVSLGRAVEDAARLVTRTAGCGGEGVRLELDHSVQVDARASELQQVFVNLIKNAVEASGEAGARGEGAVVVRCGADPRGAWATVTDRGPGVPVDRRRQIFDPFYTTKAPGKGTGLGLNIVYRILTRYRGSIGVEGEPGEGATFRVRLPIAREH